MKPKHILILGAGFGGLTLATELDELAAQNKIKVTLIDKNPSFQMGFSIQWVMMGRRGPHEGGRFYRNLKAKQVRFIRDTIEQIDAKRQIVHGRVSLTRYDTLIVALGATYAPELIPGLSQSAYNLCDLQSVILMKQALETLEKGDVVIMVSQVPFKCPPAPYEYAMLIDDLLKKRGVRNKVRLVVTSPESQPMPVAGPAAGEKIIRLLADRRIEYLPNHTPKFINHHEQTILYENNLELPYTVLGAMYPHQASQLLEQIGLTNETGFVPVELGTFKTSVESIYAIGDVAAITLPDGKPHPKAGVMAEAQAKTVASIIKSEMTGGSPDPYPGKGVCFIDVGEEKAASAEVILLGDDGPKAIIQEPSLQGLEAKGQFEQQRLNHWFDS